MSAVLAFLQAGSVLPNSLYSGELLSIALAWIVIAALCHFSLIPLSNARTQRPVILESIYRLPRWLYHRFVHAGLIFLFHIFISIDGAKDVWALSLIALVICFWPGSNATSDTHIVNIGTLLPGWCTSFKTNDLEDVKPALWLLSTVTSILVALLTTFRTTELLGGLVLASTGVLLYVVGPEFISRQDFVTSRELRRRILTSRELRRRILTPRQLRRRILLSIALPSVGCAVIFWIALGRHLTSVYLLSLHGVASTIKALAIIISIADGTALAVLATLSTSMIMRLAAVAVSWSSPTIGILLISAFSQLSLSLPRSSEKRRNLLFFVVTPLFLTTIIEGYYIRSSPSFHLTSNKHPVQQLYEINLALFERRLSTQSRTVEQAVTEYKRRYIRSPPPRFEKWFELAKANDFQLVDEFDVIMSSIIPFWGLTTELLQNRTKKIQGDKDIITFEIRDNIANYSQGHYYAPILAEWINKYSEHSLFPDFNFVVNGFDEPRINAPYEIVKAATNHGRKLVSESDVDTTVQWVDLGHKNIELDILAACPLEPDPLVEDEFPIKLVSNLTASKDYCHDPSLFSKHSFFQSPTTLLVSRTLVPLLSQCRPGGFNDILYPSPYYAIQTEFKDDDDEGDLDWRYKADGIYWSGSSTGGHSTLENWKHMHRQHIALLASSESDTPLQLLRPPTKSRSTWSPYNTTWSAVKDLLNIRLNRVVQCDLEACEAMEAAFPWVGTSDPLETTYEFKYSLDMDGNSFSGRFYRLLRSKVCVLRMSAFKEWHDDFLTPWVHYIPISSGFEELGEVTRFLIQDANGQTVGKAIADSGREWSRKVIRQQDIELVTLRILMEVARLVVGDAREEVLASSD